MGSHNSFIVVEWPESQSLMEEKGFDDNCHLINDDKGRAIYGDSAYLVSVSWLEKINKLKEYYGG